MMAKQRPPDNISIQVQVRKELEILNQKALDGREVTEQVALVIQRINSDQADLEKGILKAEFD